jgi:hypothetical protein
MANKKASALQEELGPNADLMSILASGGSANSRIFSRNNLVDYSYKTGIWLIDHALGYEVNIYGDNEEFIGKKVCLGVQNGAMNVISGRTQSYKTTQLIQMAANIAYAYNGHVDHNDTERRLVKQRVQTMSKLPLEWFDGDIPRWKFESGVVGFDTLQGKLFEIYETKMRNRKALLRATGEVDSRNRPIFMMPPSIMIIDSLQNVIEKEYDVDDKKSIDGLDELRSNTQGARTAKTIRGFLTDTLPMMAEANILTFIVAHKTANMQLQGVGGVRKQFQYGRNDERMSGGSAVEFNASTVMDFTGNSDPKTRFTVEQDGFEGNLVLFEPTKVSTNESGNEKSGRGFDLVIDKRRDGVDNFRSTILFLIDRGRISGNKASYRLINKDGAKVGESFKWKSIHNDFANDKETRALFMAIAKEEMMTLVAPADETLPGTINVIDL